MSRFRTILHMSAHPGRQALSIRRKLLLYWLCMILGVCAALTLLFSVTGVFSLPSRKAAGVLQLQLKNTQLQISQHMEALESRCLTLSARITEKLKTVLTAQGLGPEDLNNNPALLLRLQEQLYDPLNLALQTSQCSGAYLILDATTNTESPESGHSATGLYLRYANFRATGAADQDIVLYRGIPQVARSENLELHNRWNLEFDTVQMPGYRATMASQPQRLAEACSWTSRSRLPGTWEEIILLNVPILSPDNRVCGVCGAELSSLYVYLSYPELETSFGPLMTVLAPLDGDRILLEAGMPGEHNGTYLAQTPSLQIREGRYFNEYEWEKESYIGLHCPTSLHTADGSSLVTAVLIPREAFAAASRSGRIFWIGCSLAILAGTVAMSVYLSDRFTRPITRTFDAITAETLPPVRSTGLSELDALMEFAQNKARSQKPPSLPPNIEELFAAFARRAKTLSPAEQTIFQYYIAGYSITQIPELAFISIHTVKKHNSNIYQKLGVASRDELMLYIDLFRRCGRLDELTNQI